MKTSFEQPSTVQQARNRNLLRGGLVLIAALATLATVVLAQPSQLEITKHTMAGGGGTSEAGAYRVSGTVGQMGVTKQRLVAGDFKLEGGYWPTPYSTATAVDGPPPQALPTAFQVHPNVPNPFNPTTTIYFDLPAGTRVCVDVFNLRGARVRGLHCGDMPAGRHELRWDGRDDSGAPMASGVYIAQVRAGDQISSVKMSLIK